jgi:trehalose 6-phosphate synthase
MYSRLRLVLPLIFSVALGSIVFAAYQVRAENRGLRSELDVRAGVLAESFQENIEPLVQKRERRDLERLVEKFGHREHVAGIAVYDASGEPVVLSPGLPAELRTRPEMAALAADEDRGRGEFTQLSGGLAHIYALPLHDDAQDIIGTLVVLHDARYISAQTWRMWRDSLLNATLQTLLITLIALFVIRWRFVDPIARIAKWMRTLRIGEASVLPGLPEGEEFEQLAREVTHLARDLGQARSAAQEEARLRESGESLWTAERLRITVRNRLQQCPLFVVSNREPYMHVRGERQPQVIVPASGLVTALEPILSACDGTWIAHGSGNADRSTVDDHDRLRVPPDNPRYTLRRVWLTPEEERGYYLGFANEGLWPLCHTAHTRPVFRPEDWEHYQRVNRRFAEAVLDEMSTTEAPILLLQDYHFALLPRLIKEQRPGARVAIFWHIPWPNPEVCGICPWEKELLEGLLGADLIGFHTQAHCINFLGSVDRALEARTEWDRFTVTRQGHVTKVRPFPISVAFPDALSAGRPARSSSEERSALLAELQGEGCILGVGVDRVDYTKGILERFQAIERFLETYPVYQKRFTFVQVGAPSRTDIPRYREFLEEVDREARRINDRFQAGRWKPILFLREHHSHQDIQRLYRAADLCMVTSLHDGMNLVAKEFVAAREDERGVLILSTFAGASKELTDAMLVNPYDTKQLAEAIRAAIEMPELETTIRMQRMRRIVREHNIYRWAGDLLSDLCQIEIEKAEVAEVS